MKLQMQSFHLHLVQFHSSCVRYQQQQGSVYKRYTFNPCRIEAFLLNGASQSQSTIESNSQIQCRAVSAFWDRENWHKVWLKYQLNVAHTIWFMYSDCQTPLNRFIWTPAHCSLNSNFDCVSSAFFDAFFPFFVFKWIEYSKNERTKEKKPLNISV